VNPETLGIREPLNP